MALEDLRCRFSPRSVSYQGPGLLVVHSTDLLVCLCVPVHRQLNTFLVGGRGGTERNKGAGSRECMGS